MALQSVSIFKSDKTDANETITLEPDPPATSTDATIASAVYGGQLVKVAIDRKSLSFTVLQGVHPLTVTLASPNPKDEIVRLTQDQKVLASPVISQHSGVSVILIQGNN
jgi:hypothetical protein